MIAQEVSPDLFEARLERLIAPRVHTISRPLSTPSRGGSPGGPSSDSPPAMKCAAFLTASVTLSLYALGHFVTEDVERFDGRIGREGGGSNPASFVRIKLVERAVLVLDVRPEGEPPPPSSQGLSRSDSRCCRAYHACRRAPARARRTAARRRESPRFYPTSSRGASSPYVGEVGVRS